MRHKLRQIYPLPHRKGTSLGANETIDYNGIALGNRVKLRGYVDFIFSHTDDNSTDNTDFSTAADIDFLFDFSPVTGEIHLAADDEGVDLEQAFARYSFNQDFNLSFGANLQILDLRETKHPISMRSPMLTTIRITMDLGQHN